MIDIHRCRREEISKVMVFIGEFWRAGHILSKSRELVDWQHKDADGNYNFVLAFDGEILLGVLGYIPTIRYDPVVEAEPVTWLSLWKIRDDCKMPGLGLRLLRALSELEPISILAVNGINASHPPMYRSMGYKTGELSQYYFVNANIQPLLLDVNIDHPQPSGGNARALNLDESNVFEEAAEAPTVQCIPRKTNRYMAARYLNHPFYKYRILQLSCPGKNNALVVIRIARHQSSKVIRIVDFAGDPAILAESGAVFQKIMDEEHAEYCDFWQYGLPTKILEDAGFKFVEADGPVIVPNYFEPFVKQNGRILFAAKLSDASSLLICRGDGDQDRPNSMDD